MTRYEVVIVIESDRPESVVQVAVDDAWFLLERRLGEGPIATARKVDGAGRIDYVDWAGWDEPGGVDFAVRHRGDE